MAILTGKPSSISANTTSSSITLDTTELITLVDSITTDTYWTDIARVKSVLFVYRNASRQKVNLKFTMPATSSTISINQNSRNGALQCSKIVILGTANDTLTINRSQFSTASEFDLTVTDGFVAPGFSGTAPIEWVQPLSSTFSTAVVEADGGIYKNNGPDMSNGGTIAYDLSLRSSQELSAAEGYIEIDAIHYNNQILFEESSKYGNYTEYAIGLSFGERNSSGNFDNFDFAVKKANYFNPSNGNPVNENTASYLNGIQSQLLGRLENPMSSMMPGMPNQSSYINKIRIQLKDGNVEFFINNIKYQTLVGALASAAFPIFAETSLLQPYLGSMTATTGSGFPSSRISSTISNPGTIVRSVDLTGSLDSDAFPSNFFAVDPKQACTSVLDSYIEFGQGTDGFSNLSGESFVIKNIGATAMSGAATFNMPLVEGNTYTVRLYIAGYVNLGSNPTIGVVAHEGDMSDMVTISSSSLQSAVGSYVDVSYTPSVYKYDIMGSTTVVNSGVYIVSTNTTDTEYIRISKIEFIEA